MNNGRSVQEEGKTEAKSIDEDYCFSRSDLSRNENRCEIPMTLCEDMLHSFSIYNNQL